MKPNKLSFLFLILLVPLGLSVFSAVKASSTDTILHSFSGGTGDGSNPQNSLTLSGNTLYGTTDSGGTNGDGTIFKINTDGTGYTVMYNFAGGTSDGLNPIASLTLSADGNTLYGTTVSGGTYSRGTIFKINTDGTGYTVMYNFAGSSITPADGSMPEGPLTLLGNTLYGTTSSGGSGGIGDGTIFKINTDGTGYTIMYNFNGGTSDGNQPVCKLTLSGNTLWGMTNLGGLGSGPHDGTIFSINTDGTSYTVRHLFAGGTSDGMQASYKYNSMVLFGNTIFGTTYSGGTYSHGTIFSINTDGTGYAVIYNFVGATGDGSNPYTLLTLSGNTLYGTTVSGGALSDGTIFSINTDDTEYSTLYNFTGGTSDGRFPQGSLIPYGNTLYSTTSAGGANSFGTIFSYALPVTNSAPSLTAGPSGPSSSVTVGGTASFNATATTTPSTDNYYLAICKNNSITPNPSSPPTCGGLGAWCVSPSTASGSQANCSYTTQQSDIATDPNPWYAFVCDNNSNPLCSSVSQGTGSTASPFTVSAPAPTPAPTPTVTAGGGGGAMIFLQMLQARQQTQTQASTPTPAPTQTSTASLAASIRQQLSSLITQLIGMLRGEIEQIK